MSPVSDDLFFEFDVLYMKKHSVAQKTTKLCQRFRVVREGAISIDFDAIFDNRHNNR